MKKLIFSLIACIGIFSQGHATVRTVSNDPLGGAQYNSLQAAVNASSNGDTMLIEGTNIPYGLDCHARWNKSITVIGIGFNPQKDNPRKVFFSITCGPDWFVINNGGNGSKIYGIEFL